MPRLLEAGVVLHARYRIIELVAQGGMGAVYRAEDLRLVGRECAVKEIIYQEEPWANEEQMREQFYREASTLARLDHPNLPKVSDHFAENNRDYLVMDFVPGPDLQTLVQEAADKKQHLPEQQVLDWTRQLGDALSYLHAQNPPILHRDIKPANIRLTPSGLVKLVDFGLVKLMSPDETRTVTVVHGRGTAAYTPLEQYGGETGHTDVRSDIYGLGATLYHLLTNQPPISAKDRFLAPEALIAPLELNPTISERAERTILWAMSMHPDQRPVSVAEFNNALFGTIPVAEIGCSTLARANDAARNNTWGKALGDNAGLLILALLLLVFAAYVSLSPGNLPAILP